MYDFFLEQTFRDYTIPGNLEPGGSWKINFKHVYKVPLSAKSTWKIENVPIPSEGQYISLLATKIIESCQLELIGIGAPGSYLPGETKPHSKDNHYLQFNHQFPRENLSLDFPVAHDDQGRKVQINSSSSWKGKTFFKIGKIEDGAKSLTLEVPILIKKEALIEFIAKPDLWIEGENP